jgi:hypothetical protein
VKKRLVQLGGKSGHKRFAQEIRTTDGADKQRISGEDSRWFSPVLGNDRDVFGRMARCMEETQREAPECKPLVVVHLTGGKLQRRPGPGERLDTDRLQLSSAGNKVGVDVRLDRGNDFQIGLRRSGDIHIDVASRIDEDRFADTITGEQIRSLRQTGVKVPLKHRVESSVRVHLDHSTRSMTVRAAPR